ncbi:MAG: hypothetical protein IJ863_05990, partial [Spirochaetales bacterium]|nr:hypothetical protein [Spirochaetales bacterium]
MKRFLLVLLMLAMIIPVFAQGSTEPKATVAKDSVNLVISGNPYRFYALSSKGCGGDDNLV